MLTWNTGILKYPVLKAFINAVVIWVPRLKDKFLVPCWTANFRVVRKFMSHSPTDAGQTVYLLFLSYVFLSHYFSQSS